MLLGARSHMDPTGNKRLRRRRRRRRRRGPQAPSRGNRAARRRRRLGGTGGSRSGRWRRDGLYGVGAGPSATVAGAPPSGAPPTRPSRGPRCWEPPSLPASCSSAAWLHPWQPAGTEHRDSTTIDLHSKSSGLNFSRFALAIPTPAGAGLGTAKLPRPMSVLWGGDGGGWTAGECTPSPSRVYRACPRPRAVLSFRLNCTIAVRLMEA